jgi:hypothetical protein
LSSGSRLVVLAAGIHADQVLAHFELIAVALEGSKSAGNLVNFILNIVVSEGGAL